MTTILGVSIPAIGWVVIPLGIVLLFAAPRFLYGATIFAIPFSDTAVLNFGGAHLATSANAFGVQAAIYLGLLTIGREIVTGFPKRVVSAPPTLRAALLLLAAFLTFAVASLAMPLIIHGGFLVKASETTESFTPLRLTMHDVTQTAYLAFGVALAAVVAARAVDEAWRRWTVQAFVAGAVALAIWGWVQLLIVQSGHAYPRGVFNTNIQPQTQGYQETLVVSFGTLHRLSSAAVEPSIFAQCLLAAIALVSAVVLRGHAIFTRRWDIGGLIIMSSIVLLSTSTTAYIGFVFLSLLIVATLPRTTGQRWRYGAAVFALGGAAVALCLALRPVRGVFQATVLDKLDSWSAHERLSTVTDAWWHFVEYPILGTGWGTASSHDLVVFLLANTGVLGLLAFVSLAAYVLGHLRIAADARSRSDDQAVALAQGVGLAFATLLFLNIVTGFAFVFGHLWLILGLAIACSAAIEIETRVLVPRGVDISADLESRHKPRTSPARAARTSPEGGR